MCKFSVLTLTLRVKIGVLLPYFAYLQMRKIKGCLQVYLFTFVKY